MLNYFFCIIRQYILILFTATIFFFNFKAICYSKENIFFVKGIEIEKKISLDFSRDKVIEETFKVAFNNLLSKVLLSKDVHKLKKIKKNEIKQVIESFEIYDESFKKNTYKANFNVYFDNQKLSLFLAKKNLFFSNPKNITVVLFPILYLDNEVKLYNRNIFFTDWFKSQFNSKLINFILPIEDINDLSRIEKIKNNIEDLNADEIAKKYDTSNYIVAIMKLENQNLKTFLKMKFENNKFNKNFSHEIINISDGNEVLKIIDDLKLKIEDSWKTVNIINFALPLSLSLHFNNIDLESINELEKIFKKIDIINNFTIEEFSINKTIFKINYFGNPKKLYKALLDFNYLLENKNDNWVLEKYE